MSRRAGAKKTARTAAAATQRRSQAPDAKRGGRRDKPRTTPSRPPLQPLHVVLIVAFALRFATVLWLSDTVPYSDYSYYDTAASRIAADWSFFFDKEKVHQYGGYGWWPPLYPFSLASVYSVVGHDHRVIVFLQVFLGTLVCWLLYRIGRRAVNERVGLIAASLAAVSPTYIFATNLTGSENLFVVWLAWGLLLALGTWGTARRRALAGVVFALGALTRAIGLMVPVIVALWMRHRAPERRSWLIGAATLLVACGLTILPWTIRNAVVVGSPALVCFGGGVNFYFGHNDTQIGYRDIQETPMSHLNNQADIDAMGYRLGFEHIGAKPLGFVTRGVAKVRALFGSAGWAPHANSAILLPEGFDTDPTQARLALEMRNRQRAKNRWLDGLFTWLANLHSWLLVAAGLVAATVYWKRLPDSMRLMVYLSLYWVGSHVLFWGKPRFRYPMEIFLVLLAAFAVDAWLSRKQRAQ